MLTKSLAVCLIASSLLVACAGSPESPAGKRSLEAAKANTRLGIEYLRAGELDKSRDRLQKAIRLAPDYPGAHDAIAVLYDRAGDSELAEKHYLLSIRLDPESASAHNNYGQFLCGQGRTGEAEKTFRRAAENPYYRSPWVPLTNAGICLMDTSENKRAEEYFRQALATRPKYAPALLRMARISFDGGQHLSARAYVQRYQQAASHTAESLWLAIRTEYALKDHAAWGNYALTLKNDFPDSPQFRLLQEWENERRAGN